MELPYEAIAAYFGITLSASVLALLKVLQWALIFLITVSGYALAWYTRWRKRRDAMRGHDLDWVVIGAGAVTGPDMFHHIRTFAEKPVVAEFGELFAEILREAAEATIASEGTQILRIADTDLLERIWARAVNKLNEYSKPKIVGELAEASGPSGFVAALTCGDYAKSRKIRISIRSIKELERYKKNSQLQNAVVAGLLGKILYFAKFFHLHDALLTAEMALAWHGNPTPSNALCRPVTLHGEI